MSTIHLKKDDGTLVEMSGTDEGSVRIDVDALPLPEGSSTLAEQQTQTTHLARVADAVRDLPGLGDDTGVGAHILSAPTLITQPAPGFSASATPESGAQALVTRVVDLAPAIPVGEEGKANPVVVLGTATITGAVDQGKAGGEKWLVTDTDTQTAIGEVRDRLPAALEGDRLAVETELGATGDLATEAKQDAEITATQAVEIELQDKATEATAADTLAAVDDLEDKAGTLIAQEATTAKDATLTNGTQKAIVRGGAKGVTVAADVTSTAEGADRQALDVQSYHGGTAIDPRDIHVSGAPVTATNPARVLSTATQTTPSYVRFPSQDGFGRPLIVATTPVIQATFANGMKSAEWESYTTLTGTVTTTAEIDGLGYVRTGANASSVAERRSVSSFTYRAGQSFEIMFTTVFSAPAVGGTQIVGAGSNDGVGVGFNGTAFGFLIRSGGRVEQRVLTITTASTTAQNVTVTLDGVGTLVAVTNSGNTVTTAREIAAGDYSATGTGWDAYQLGSTVVFVTRRPGPRAGSYSLTATTAIGSFAQQLAGLNPTDTWFAQTAWSGDRLDGTGPTGKTIDTTKGQIWRIVIPHLGFGSIDLYWQNPTTGEFTLCHRKEFANATAIPNLLNPTLRLWLYASGAANITAASRSMLIACHGELKQAGRTIAIPAATKTNIGTALLPVVSIRTERFDNGNVNRSPYKTLVLMFTAATTGEVTIQAYLNATLTAANFVPHPNDAVMSYDISATAFTGGNLVGTFCTSRNGSGIPIDVSGYGLALPPGYVITFAAAQNSGANGTVIVAVNGHLANGIGLER